MSYVLCITCEMYLNDVFLCTIVLLWFMRIKILSVCLSCLVFFNWYFVWKLQLPIGKGGISQNIRFLLQRTGYLVGNLQFPITYGSLWIQFPPRISYDMLWTKREQYLIFSSHLIIVRTFVSLFCTTYRCVCLALKIIFFQMKQ